MRALVVLVLLAFAVPAWAQSIIIYTRPGGGISTVHPAPEFLARFPDEASAMAALRTLDVPSGATNIREVPVSDLPLRIDAGKTQNLRDAWKWDEQSGRVVIDPAKIKPLPQGLGP